MDVGVSLGKAIQSGTSRTPIRRLHEDYGHAQRTTRPRREHTNDRGFGDVAAGGPERPRSEHPGPCGTAQQTSFVKPAKTPLCCEAKRNVCGGDAPALRRASNLRRPSGRGGRVREGRDTWGGRGKGQGRAGGGGPEDRDRRSPNDAGCARSPKKRTHAGDTFKSLHYLDATARKDTRSRLATEETGCAALTEADAREASPGSARRRETRKRGTRGEEREGKGKGNTGASSARPKVARGEQ